jgi:hypothetical protein
MTGDLALRLTHARLAQSHENTREQISPGVGARNLTASASGSGHRGLSSSVFATDADMAPDSASQHSISRNCEEAMNLHGCQRKPL